MKLLQRRKVKLFYIFLLGTVAVFFFKLGQEMDFEFTRQTARTTTTVHIKTLPATIKQAKAITEPVKHAPINTQDPYEDLDDAYLRIERMDYENKGDFPCSESLAINSCLVHRTKVRDFEVICDRIGPYCKGFVVTRGRRGEIIAYFKREIKRLKTNNKTDVFVKKEFRNNIELRVEH